MSRSGEFSWIETYLAPLAGEGAFALKDDAALLPVEAGKRVVITQDAIMEGVHFLPDDPLDTVAQKALRVNVSDIIAKGATPTAWSMALGVPDLWKDADMERFAQGLAADQKTYGLALTGGDTYRSPGGLCVAITLFGSVEEGRYKSRAGASDGDQIYVSGTIGNSAIGLRVATGALQVEASVSGDHLRAYRIPQPPFGLQDAIAQFATASMDVSDGLVGDCRKLCAASQVVAQIECDDIPLSPLLRDLLARGERLWPTILSGGDDYQVLCTVEKDNAIAFEKAALDAGHILTRIGSCAGLTNGDAKQGVSITRSGVPIQLERDSFSHF
ncbi:MAG: thiamine-phosphate kinase [Pseudomonadota bacterium]